MSLAGPVNKAARSIPFWCCLSLTVRRSQWLGIHTCAQLCLGDAGVVIATEGLDRARDVISEVGRRSTARQALDLGAADKNGSRYPEADQFPTHGLIIDSICGGPVERFVVSERDSWWQLWCQLWGL